MNWGKLWCWLGFHDEIELTGVKHIKVPFASVDHLIGAFCLRCKKTRLRCDGRAHRWFENEEITREEAVAELAHALADYLKEEKVR